MFSLILARAGSAGRGWPAPALEAEGPTAIWMVGALLAGGLLRVAPATVGGSCTQVGTNKADGLRGTNGPDILCGRTEAID